MSQESGKKVRRSVRAVSGMNTKHAEELREASRRAAFTRGTSPKRKHPAIGVLFVRILTTIHALGSLVLVVMTSYLLLGGSADQLSRTPGSRLMVDALGPWLPAFLGSLAVFLGAMAWSSHRRRAWAWRAAVASYGIGVLGSLWEVSVGIHQAWLSALINGGVVALLLSQPTRCVYFTADHRG